MKDQFQSISVKKARSKAIDRFRQESNFNGDGVELIIALGKNKELYNLFNRILNEEINKVKKG